MNKYIDSDKEYLASYLENAAYNLFEFSDQAVSDTDIYGNIHTSYISPLFLSDVIDVPQNQEFLDLIMKELPFYFREPKYRYDSAVKNLTVTRDIGQNDVPSALQSDFWEVWFRNALGDAQNNILLDIYNKLRYPFVNENQYLSAMLFSELADKTFYSTEDATEANRITFQDNNSDSIEYLNDIMDTKLSAIYSILNYSPNQSELISCWTDSLYQSGQLSSTDIAKEAEIFKLQDLKHELLRRKFAGSTTLYTLALKSINFQGTVAGTLQVSAFGVLDSAFNDTRLIRLLNAFTLISGSTLTDMDFTPIDDFYEKSIGINDASMPLSILEPLYYTSAKVTIQGHKYNYSSNQFYYQNINATDSSEETYAPTLEVYQKARLRNQNTTLDWVTPERVISSIEQGTYLTLDTLDEEDSAKSKLAMDKGVTTKQGSIDIVTLDIAAQPIPVTAYTNTSIDITANRFFYYRNNLQETMNEEYPYLRSVIANGNSVSMIDPKWMNYIQTLTSEKSKVSDIPLYGAQVSKFYPYTSNFYREKQYFYLVKRTEEISAGVEPNVYADLYLLNSKALQNWLDPDEQNLLEMFSRSRIASILVPRNLTDSDVFDADYSSERDIAYTFSRGIIPFLYQSNDLINPGKAIFNEFTTAAESSSLVFQDNITDRGYTPATYVFLNSSVKPSNVAITITSDTPFADLKGILTSYGYDLAPTEETVAMQYLIMYTSDSVASQYEFRFSEPIYILNGYYSGTEDIHYPRIVELLQTDKIVWTSFQENYRSEYTVVANYTEEAKRVLSAVVNSGDSYDISTITSQDLPKDDEGLLLWINPYLNFTSKSSSPLRYKPHAKALPNVLDMNVLDYFGVWDSKIFPSSPDLPEDTLNKKAILPSEKDALLNLAESTFTESAEYGFKRTYLKIDKTENTVEVWENPPYVEVPSEEDRRKRLTVNQFTGDPSSYDYNYMFRYFQGFTTDSTEPTTPVKDSDNIYMLKASDSVYKTDYVESDTFNAICYDMVTADDSSIANPIIAMNVYPEFIADSSKEEMCLFSIGKTAAVYICKEDSSSWEVQVRIYSGSDYVVAISLPAARATNRITLAYSSLTKEVRLAVGSRFSNSVNIPELSELAPVEGKYAIRFFFDTANPGSMDSLFKGNVYDVRVYNRTLNLFDFYTLHLGMFRELYSYAPYNNIMGYNIYKDIGIMRVLYRDFPVDRALPSITHIKAFTRSVWDSILLDLGYEDENFDPNTDYDIVDPTDSTNSFAIQQELVEGVETLSNQTMSGDKSLDIVTTMGKYTVYPGDDYTIATVMLYPVDYDDAGFVFDANTISVTYNEDLSEVDLSNLKLPVTGDSSTLELTMSLAPNFQVKDTFYFASAEAIGNNILTEYYDKTIGEVLLQRSSSNSSQRSFESNYVSIPIQVPVITNTDTYLTGIQLGKTKLISSLTTLLRATSYYDELQIPGVRSSYPMVEYTKYDAIRVLREGSYFITCAYPMQIRPYYRDKNTYPFVYGKVQLKIEVSSEDHCLYEQAVRLQEKTADTIYNLESFSENPLDNRTFPHKNINIRLYVADRTTTQGSSDVYKLVASNIPADVFEFKHPDSAIVQDDVEYYIAYQDYTEAPLEVGITYHWDDTTSEYVLDTENTTDGSHYKKLDHINYDLCYDLQPNSSINQENYWIKDSEKDCVYLDAETLSKGVYLEDFSMFFSTNYKAPFWVTPSNSESPESFCKYNISKDDINNMRLAPDRAYTLLMDYDAYISEISFVDNTSIADSNLLSNLARAINRSSNQSKLFYSGTPIQPISYANVQSYGSGFRANTTTIQEPSSGKPGIRYHHWLTSTDADDVRYFGDPAARSADLNFMVRSGQNLSLASMMQATDAYSYPISADNVSATLIQDYISVYTSAQQEHCTNTAINEASVLKSIQETRRKEVLSSIQSLSTSNLSGLFTGFSTFQLLLTDSLGKKAEYELTNIADIDYSYYKYSGEALPLRVGNNTTVSHDTLYQNNLFQITDFYNTEAWTASLYNTDQQKWLNQSIGTLSSYISDPWIDNKGKMVAVLKGSSQYRLKYVSTGTAYSDSFEVALSVKLPDKNDLSDNDYAELMNNVIVKALCYNGSKLKYTVVLDTLTYNKNNWVVFSANSRLKEINTITFEIVLPTEGNVCVSKPVVRIPSHISFRQGFSDTLSQERSKTDSNIVDVVYSAALVLRNKDNQQIVPVVFKSEVGSSRVYSGASVATTILGLVDVIGTYDQLPPLVAITSPWERKISMSNYDAEKQMFTECRSYKPYIGSNSNTDILYEEDGNLYVPGTCKVIFDETTGVGEGILEMRKSNILTYYKSNLSIPVNTRSFRLKNCSFKLLTNCFNPENVQNNLDSEVCITNFQASHINTMTGEEKRLLEVEYLPIIYNETEQHVSFNLLLNRMNSYMPQSTGDPSSEHI